MYPSFRIANIKIFEMYPIVIVGIHASYRHYINKMNTNKIKTGVSKRLVCVFQTRISLLLFEENCVTPSVGIGL